MGSSAPSVPLSTSETHWNPRLWGVLLTVSTVVGLDALDVSMVGVALPSIRADLGLSTSALQWVVSGYVLGYGGLLLLGGRAADLLGRRRVFLVAVAVFAVASLLGGLVDDGALLIATRFVKGLAAAFTAPAALSIITTTFHEGPARTKAISVFAVFGASGYSAGLVFSGLLTEVGWRWTFLLPVPIALAALAFGAKLLPSYPRRTGGGYDLPGAITGAAGSLLLVFAVVEAPQAGWVSARTLVSFVVAVALLTAFVFIEKRSRHPLLRLGILRSGPLARANLGGGLFFGAYIGFQFVVMQYLQAVLGWSALQTALGFLPAALIVATFSPRIEPLIDRIGTSRVVFAGVVAHVAGYALFLRVDEHSGYAGSVLPSMILLGIGFTLAFTAFNIQGTNGVSDDEQGLAGGLLNTSLQVGGAIGLAIVTAVLTSGNGADGSTTALLNGLRPALVVVTGIAVLGVLVAASGVVRRRAATARPAAEPATGATSGRSGCPEWLTPNVRDFRDSATGGYCPADTTPCPPERSTLMPRIARTLLALLTAVTAATAAAGVSAPAATAAPANDYCQGQCNDILPPGENGNATLVDILANRLFGTRPAHTDDQLKPYEQLAGNYQGLTNDTIDNYFNDSSFGIAPGDVASTIQPRDDVKIVRDKQTGVPHVYGTTRSGTEFGAGYAAAQDRLWMMDVFRHVGRGQLTGFAGGAEANRQLEQSFWAAAPYTEQDLQAQVDRIAGSGPDGAQALQDITAYLDGLNTYVTQSHDGRYFPGEYVLTGHVDAITNAGTIAPFTPTDLIAIAGVVGALFGSGGGGEVQSALVKQAAVAKYGPELGERVWESFREQNDPEADLTLHDGQSFPYGASPANPDGVAMPDPGSVAPQQEVYDPTGSAASQTPAKADVATPANLAPAKGMFDDGVLPAGLLTDKHGMSNALVVSGSHTDDGHPLAVFGPQTGYFAPQLLMLEELQGPGISARGVAFAGTNFYVQLGRGQDYAWSATSASQDITDTFAVTLCSADGSVVTENSNSYLDNGQCVPMEALEADDSWKPTIADTTAAGSYRLIVYRTRYGLVTSRATIGGTPVAYTSQRSTYRHEADSIIGFQHFNDPARMATAQQFQQAAAQVNYTFNWFYVNSADAAYYNSGWNPVRPSTVDPNLPVTGDAQHEWAGWDPAANDAQRTPDTQHPNSIGQDYYVSWNNKQAEDYTAAGFGDGSVHRSNLLDSRLEALVDSGQPVSRSEVVQAMEDAAVTDLRGEDVLPELLRVIDSQPITDPAQAQAVSQLKTWLSDGAKRVETTPGSHTYADADAIRVMDAWWPLLVQAEFRPGMGDDLFTATVGALQLNESPSNGQTGPTSGSASANESVAHRGSAFQLGWWSYVDKDLRAVLGEPVAGPLAQTYCGGGDLATCRTALLTSLAQAAAQPAAEVYPADDNCSAGQQWCADSIVQRPLGGVTDPASTWQNRPTFQQVVQFAGHR